MAEQQKQQQQQQQQQRRRSGGSGSEGDFQLLSVDDMEAAMTMSVSDAMFSSVLPSYPVGAHIQCRCQVSDAGDLGLGCWIGLFRVGWSSAQDDCVCRAECRAERGDRSLVAVFSQTQLPRDTQEFYQFCFVAPDGVVKGASTPFVFRSAPADDFVAELDDELQGIVVTARNAELENQLADMRLRSDEQQRHLQEAVDQSRQLQRKLQEAEEQQRRLVAENEANCRRAAELARASEASATAGQQLEAVQRELEATVDQLTASRQAASIQEEERRRLLQLAEETDAELGSCRHQLLEERRLRQIALQEAQEARQQRAESEAALAEEEEAHAQCRRRAEQAQADGLQLQESLASLQLRLDGSQCESEQLKQLQARHGSLAIAFDGVKQQYHRAEERERVTKQKYDDVIRFNRQMLQREESLRARLDDLQRRLHEGAVEYKKLLRRFKEACGHAQQEELPEEFHDARSDEQSLLDFGDEQMEPQQEQEQEQAEIYRPPLQATAPQSPPQRCPMCQAARDDFDEQQKFEEHVDNHFD